jgi:putative endonuclease
MYSTLFYYTYVLRSTRDRELYIGWTNNLKSRLKEHNSGNVKATRSRVPFKLIYYEACLDRDGAIKREKQLKSGFGRGYLKRRLGV